jgi:hypothetical protein
MTAALQAESVELLALVSLSSRSDELGVWIVDRPGLAALATYDREPLLSQMLTAQERRQVGRREDNGAVGEREHLVRPPDYIVLDRHVRIIAKSERSGNPARPALQAPRSATNDRLLARQSAL